MILSRHALAGVRSQPDQLGASGGEPQGLAGEDDGEDTDADGDGDDGDDEDDDARELFPELPVQCLKLV